MRRKERFTWKERLDRYIQENFSPERRLYGSYRTTGFIRSVTYLTWRGIGNINLKLDSLESISNCMQYLQVKSGDGLNIGYI